MIGSPEGYVSRSEIARLAGVGRSAVTNWESRHPGFPAPVLVAGAEVFSAAAVEAWLDGRVIARNALGNGEREGSTYGDRFRRNRGESVQGRKPPSAGDRPACRVFPEDPLPSVDTLPWRALDDMFRGVALPVEHRDLLLGAVYLRATDAVGWGRVAGGNPVCAKDLARRLEPVIPEARGAGDGALGDGTERLLARAARVVDETVPRWGGAAVFRYLLDRFSLADGRKGGELHTPRSVVEVLVETAAPRPGDRIYDPFCRSGEILAAAADHARRQGLWRTPSVYGRTPNGGSAVRARMNLALHRAEGGVDVGPADLAGDTPLSGAPFNMIVSNPPFNMDLRGDQRFAPWYLRYGVPPAHNANFAWLQYVVACLAPEGRAAVLMSNGASSSENPREKEIRAGMVEDGLVEGLIALPPHLFHSTAVPATVWLLSRPVNPRGELLFVDGSGLGDMTGRTHRVLPDADVGALAGAVSAWRRRGRYEEIPGFSRSVPLEEVREQGYRLSPQRYLPPRAAGGASSAPPRLQALRRRLADLHARAAEADAAVERELGRIGL